MTGTIPIIGTDKLALQILGISSNLISGTIPSYFGNNTQLIVFSANDNLLTGTVPNLVKLLRLQFLYLQDNKLTGQLDFFAQPADYDRTHHVATTIPDLSFVDLSNNEFTGILSSEIFNVSVNLISFAVSGNCLHGTIPEQICGLNKLQFLDLDGLSTASMCRARIFPAVSSLTSFVLRVEFSTQFNDQ
jgi:hypothetical protein